MIIWDYFLVFGLLIISITFANKCFRKIDYDNT